jgi:ABC-2 type transport system ATP-binding protein
MTIEIKHLRKRFQRKAVLKDIDLTIRPGTCVGILGANGSGKSTMLSILAGVQNADGGEFLWDGRDLLRDSKTRAAKVGYVPQGTPLIEELTARDNLLLWYDRKQMERELEDGVLKLLGIGEFLKVPVSKMSGGMKKRLSIGCAMATQPPLLLLDEPTAALDLACKQSIAAWLRQYKAQGGTLLLTTHDVMELDLCDQWYIIKDGINVPFTFQGDVERLVEQL